MRLATHLFPCFDGTNSFHEGEDQIRSYHPWAYFNDEGTFSQRRRKGWSWRRWRVRDGQRFGCATRLHKAREMPKEQFRRAVEKELTGRETEPHEIIYFKIYKSQIPVVEQALETAALMLGTDKSRGYCLEMICADFLAGANLENGNFEILLQSTIRLFSFLPYQRQVFFERVNGETS